MLCLPSGKPRKVRVLNLFMYADTDNPKTVAFDFGKKGIAFHDAMRAAQEGIMTKLACDPGNEGMQDITVNLNCSVLCRKPSVVASIAPSPAKQCRQALLSHGFRHQTPTAASSQNASKPRNVMQNEPCRELLSAGGPVYQIDREDPCLQHEWA